MITTIVGFLVSGLEGYLLYTTLRTVNPASSTSKMKRASLILSYSVTVVFIKSFIQVSAATILSTVFFPLASVLLIFGLNMDNAIAWLIWVMLALYSEFVPGVVFYFVGIDIASAMNDNNKFTILGMVVAKLSQALLVIVFRKYRVSRGESAPLSLAQISLLIICTFQIVFGMTIYYWNLTGSAMPMAYSIIFSIGVGAFLVVALYNTEQAMKHAQDKRDSALMEKQIAAVQQMSLLVEKFRELQHDYRNHLQLLHSLVARGKYTEAELYYHELLMEFEDINALVIENQPELTSIILLKRHLAEIEGISLSIRVPAKLDTDVKSKDLIVVFSNLLDNALEACRCISARGHIRLDVIIKNGSFIIEIENPTTGIIGYKSGGIKSTKPNPLKHGYGLRIVSQVVAKYDGDIEISPNDAQKLFRVSISLPLTVGRVKEKA
jgi:hypothetical protein